MASRTERFERHGTINKSASAVDDLPEDELARFSPEEEAKLLNESDALKTVANDVFAKGGYGDAIETYNKALNVCPRYLYFERAILKSNVAACHIKLQQWKDADKIAGESLNLLDEAEGKKKKKVDTKVDEDDADVTSEAKDDEEKDEVEEEADEEIISAGAAKAEDTSAKGKRKTDIERIRAKALLRRGKARMEIGSWSSLQGAEEDYKVLSAMVNLSESDRKTVKIAMVVLPARTKAAQEKEVGEMMGKLKDLGNGILKPFGLSTDMFGLTKDEKTGGYSMNFNNATK